MIDGMSTANFDGDLRTRGWRSLYYGEKEPVLSLAVELTTELSIRFVTVFSSATAELRESTSRLVRFRAQEHEMLVPLWDERAKRVFMRPEEAPS